MRVRFIGQMKTEYKPFGHFKKEIPASLPARGVFIYSVFIQFFDDVRPASMRISFITDRHKRRRSDAFNAV